jgi:hypothetical protein
MSQQKDETYMAQPQKTTVKREDYITKAHELLG